MRPWICTLMVILTLVVVACSTPVTPPPTEVLPTATLSPTATLEIPPATPKPTPVPQHLVLCAREPDAVSPFIVDQSGNDLLALFYENPAERVGYRWEARLVDYIPSIESGDVVTKLVSVYPGARYVDIDSALKTHMGDAPLELPQLIVTFTLKSGLHWSNSLPLTSEDVILGYDLAQSSGVHGRWRTLVERTARFVAMDARTLRWEGIPGYMSVDYPGFLFPPQPVHRWQGLSLEEILKDRTPPSTGPFQIIAWEARHEVRLAPNLYYAGPAPKLESVIFRFPQVTPESVYDLLASGTCDVILPDLLTETDWREWSILTDQGEAMIWADPAPVLLRLDFNLAPSSSRITLLSDPQTRMGLAHCIDRARLSEVLPGEALLPADSYIPPGHPAFDMDSVWRVPYDVDVGCSLLDEVGWRDEDEDGVREAYDVAGIKDGTPLSLTLHLSPQYFVTAAYLAANLEACGVGVNPQPTEAHLLYAADAVSPLFGRSFELALFGWRAELPQICGAWMSDRIPTVDNGWFGENFSGYASETYDAACQQALTAIDPAVQWRALQEAQAVLTADLPTLFLTWRAFWFVAHPRVQGLKPDASTYSTIWNVEELFVGD